MVLRTFRKYTAPYCCCWMALMTEERLSMEVLSAIFQKSSLMFTAGNGKQPVDRSVGWLRKTCGKERRYLHTPCVHQSASSKEGEPTRTCSSTKLTEPFEERMGVKVCMEWKGARGCIALMSSCLYGRESSSSRSWACRFELMLHF